MHCGLLGGKLGHSYSPQIHGHLGAYSYKLFERQPEELEDFLKHGDFTGLNVTIPYKKAVIPYCSELSERAKALGAVNTIVRRADGSLIGHNTDYFGFETMLRNSKLQVTGKKVILSNRVDPRVLGGVSIEMDGKMLDDSLRTRLETIRHNLIDVIV